MQFPENLRYTHKHEWVRIDGDNAYVGITDFAQSELGDIVYVDINSEGQCLAAAELFGTVEAVKTVSDLFMPIEGEVVAVNPALNNQPDLVNNDPYGEGWMIKIKPANLSDIDSLLTVDAYKNLLGF